MKRLLIKFLSGIKYCLQIFTGKHVNKTSRVDYHLNRVKQIQSQLKINRMQTINQIKDCQAIGLGYNSFRDLVLNPKKDQELNHLNLCVDRSIEEYARQMLEKYNIGKL